MLNSRSQRLASLGRRSLPQPTGSKYGRTCETVMGNWGKIEGAREGGDGWMEGLMIRGMHHEGPSRAGIKRKTHAHLILTFGKRREPQGNLRSLDERVHGNACSLHESCSSS